MGASSFQVGEPGRLLNRGRRRLAPCFEACPADHGHGILAKARARRHVAGASFRTPRVRLWFASAARAASPDHTFGSPLLRGLDTLCAQPEDHPLQIAIVIERFVPGAGGVENVAWQVAHELCRQGDDVTVLTREAAPGAAVATEIVRAPAFWQPLRIPIFSRGVAGRTRGRRFDVVHSFSHTRHQDLFRAGGGSYLDYLRRNHAGAGLALRHLSPRHRVRLDIERHVFRRTQQRVQCASRLVADALEADHGLDASRILLLPNAVDREAFRDPQAAERGAKLRQELDPSAPLVCLFVGSGWRRKGLATALEGLARAEDLGTVLWVAGRDPKAPWERRGQELGIASRVRFLGEVRDMPATYQAADVVVLPTHYDAFANVTLEAAAAARPIITTRANGASEWLGDDVQLVDDRDPTTGAIELAAALSRLTSAERRQGIGTALARRADAFDWSAHVATLRREYDEIARARIGPGGLS